MKRLFLLISLLFSWWAGNSVHASHNMGVDLTYQCINNCTIRVHLRAYRDCTGINLFLSQPTFTPTGGVGCTAPQLIGAWSTQVITEVTPICPGYPTACTTPGAAINGVEEYYWWADYNICNSGGCTFTISWSDCCRNPAITSGASNNGIQINATTINTGLTPCNSSPQFTTPPVPYICAGQPYTFNQGAVDPEGDSLSYSLGPCYDFGTTQVTYNAGYSPTAPLGPGWNVTINPANGDITVTPTPGPMVVGVLCVYVTEWRNGLPINTIVRDIQMTVINCPNNTVPISAGVTNVSGGWQTAPWSVSVCSGTPLSFNIPCFDPNAGQSHTVFWNQNIPGGQFYNSTNITQQDTVTGNQPTSTFYWVPPAQGTYTFLVTMRDNSCPIFGQAQYTITINVIGGLNGATANWAPAGCTEVTFSSTTGVGGSPPYTYLWSGDGNLGVNPQNTTPTFNHVYPGPGSYAYTCIITDAYGCQAIINDTVVILTGPTANAGPDVSICSGFSVALGAAPIPGQTYSWFPATNLSSGSVSNPTFSYTNPGSTPVTFNYIVSASAGGCTSVDYVEVVVFPTPQAGIIGNLQICNGSSTTLTGTGGTQFTWSDGSNGNSITVSPSTNTTYTVIATDNGCASPPAQVTVTVAQGPSAIITGPTEVCPGSPATLTVVGGNSWQWSNGSTNQTITLPVLNGPTTVSVTPYLNGCAGNQVSYTVNIAEKPTAAFTASNACFGFPVQFTDGSSVVGGNMIAWSWNFADPGSGVNNSSVSQNPTHDFSGPGTYNVTLISTSYNGCKDTVSVPVTIYPLPLTEFTFESVCDGQTMTFNDITPGNIVSWSWNFGDGVTANVANPSHTYPGPGAYNVTLTATDANGCSKSRTKTVFVYPLPVPAFTWEHHCFNGYTDFTNASTLNDPFGTTIMMYIWNFGDPASGTDNVSNEVNPTHYWSTPGNYMVTLTVVTSPGCSTTISIEVPVDAIPMPVINYDTICNGFSATVSLGNVPAGYDVVWYYTPNDNAWFHEGEVFVTPPLGLTTIFYAAYQDQDGCIGPRWPVYAFVNGNPGVFWDVSSQQVEIPNAVVEFIVSGSTIPIVSWMWDFGDGTTSTQMSPVHQYNQAGWYDIMLTVVDTNGCKEVYELYEYIEVIENIRFIVPNAFTPNGDGVNDDFFIVTQLITDFSLVIVDRWGQVMFETRDLNFRWNGKDKKNFDAPEGNYTWMVKGQTYNGTLFNKSGTITLLR